MSQYVTAAGPQDHPEILAVWEASVRATHHFVSEADIARYRGLIGETYLHAVSLWGVRDEVGKLCGFVGVAEDRVEMLFVSPERFGQGLGRALMDHAVRVLGARELDVNEQNPGAVRFYERQGFAVVGCSPLDGEGRPYPLLHMRLAP